METTELPAENERDGGEEMANHRRCLASGALLPKEALIRFALSPDGVLVPDLEQKLPGRGLWLQPDRSMIEKAVRKNLFARAAKQRVSVPPDLSPRLERLVRQKFLHRLGLARRAGKVVQGFEAVRAGVRDGGVTLLIEASDGAANGQRKIAESAAGRPAPAMTIRAFRSDELGRALGRDIAVHVGVAHGSFADALWNQAQLAERLAAPNGTSEDR